MGERRARALAWVLAVCLLVSACGGRVPPPPSQSPAPAPAASPAPPEAEPATLPEPASGEPSRPGESGPPESSEPSVPPEGTPGAEGESGQPSSLPPEGGSSRPDDLPEPPPEESREPDGSEPPDPPEDPSQPETPEESDPGSGSEQGPGEPEALPEGCRWLNITEASVLGFINRERSKEGLTPLTLDGDLTAAARVRAEEMYRGNYVRHTRPGGEPWETVLGETPVEYVRAGENLAWCNHGVGEEIGAFQWFSFWKESASHREAMMDAQYTSCGVAVLTGPYYDGEDQSYAVAIFCTY